MNNNVLYSWLGHSDLGAPDRSQPSATRKGLGLGPVGDTLLHLANKLDHAILFLDADEGPEFEKKGPRYQQWLREQIPQKRLQIHLDRLPKEDPSRIDKVFGLMSNAIAAWEEKLGVPEQRYFLYGPGTSAMATTTLVLSRLQKTKGELWQPDERNQETGCRRIVLPFDAIFEYAPDPSLRNPASFENFQTIVASPSTQYAYALARKAGQVDWPVLILGSTGTGKEELAREIHRHYGKSKPFQAINCGAFPESLIESLLFGYKKGAFTGANQDTPGIFEAAGDGVLFLDEVGELPLSAQTRLLRVLQEKKITRVGDTKEITISCRIVAATHRDLFEEVQSGRFREDLLFRLAEIIITLDDLRQRPEDLQAMIDTFWQKIVDANSGLPGRQLSASARDRLLTHDWPGNVRELMATLRRMVFFAEGPLVKERDVERVLIDSIKKQRSPKGSVGSDGEEKNWVISVPKDSEWRESLVLLRKKLIEQALSQTQGNATKAARLLGITPQHLHRLRT